MTSERSEYTYRVKIEETSGSVIDPEAEPELEPAQPEHTNESLVDARCEPDAGVITRAQRERLPQDTFAYDRIGDPTNPPKISSCNVNPVRLCQFVQPVPPNIPFVTPFTFPGTTMPIRTFSTRSVQAPFYKY